MRAFTGTFACTVIALGCGDLPADDFASQDQQVRPSSAPVHYLVTRDFRKCMYPACGGWWVKQVNAALTRCPDRTSAESCYVVELDTNALGPDVTVSDNGVLALGSFKKLRGGYPKFTASALWLPGNPDLAATGAFYNVHFNGIYCITTPCNNVDAALLNSSQPAASLANLNLKDVAAPESANQAAYDAIYGAGLLSAGAIGPGLDGGDELVASQFYLPYTPKAPGCQTDNECTLSAYTKAVNSPEQCYCAMCPQAMLASEADANQKSWELHCSNVRLMCPMVMCIDPGSAVCSAGTCTSTTTF